MPAHRWRRTIVPHVGRIQTSCSCRSCQLSMKKRTKPNSGFESFASWAANGRRRPPARTRGSRTRVYICRLGSHSSEKPPQAESHEIEGPPWRGCLERSNLPICQSANLPICQFRTLTSTLRPPAARPLPLRPSRRRWARSPSCLRHSEARRPHRCGRKSASSYRRRRCSR